MNNTAFTAIVQTAGVPIVVPQKRLTFAQLAQAEPKLAEIKNDVLHNLRPPLAMPGYDRCFREWVLPRVEALGLSVQDAETAEGALRVAWSSRAAVLAEESRQPFSRAFTLTIESEGKRETLTYCDLRRLLKVLLRSYSFRLRTITYAEGKPA